MTMTSRPKPEFIRQLIQVFLNWIQIKSYVTVINNQDRSGWRKHIFCRNGGRPVSLHISPSDLGKNANRYRDVSRVHTRFFAPCRFRTIQLGLRQFANDINFNEVLFWPNFCHSSGK